MKTSICCFFGAGLLLICCGCEQKATLGDKSDGKDKKDYDLMQMVEELQGVGEMLDAPVIELSPRAIREVLPDITGELTPAISTIIKPMMDGKLIFLREIKVGDFVKEGERIAKIDDRDLEDDIRQQEQANDIAVKTIDLDTISLEQKKKKLEFDRGLAKKKYISTTELETSELETQRAELSLQQAQISLKQEKSRLQKLLRRREFVYISAPFDGMVVLAEHLKNSPQTGNLLNEEIQTWNDKLVGPGTELFGLLSHKDIMARCLATGRDKAKIKIGQTVEVIVHSHRTMLVTGVVKKVSDIPDGQTHGYKIWIALDEVDKSFASGMFVRADIELAYRENTIVVERVFVKEKDGRPYVQLVTDGIVRNATVELGLRRGLEVELVSGVQFGDSLIASKQTFAPDQEVNPVPVQFSETSAVAENHSP